MTVLSLSNPSFYETLADRNWNRLLKGFNLDDYGRIPQANILEFNDRFRIDLAVPGFTKEQISIQFQNQLLEIKGEVNEASDEAKVLNQEFKASNFLRRFTLPKLVEVELISASFENGVLQIQIPKKEELKEKEPREITIH